MSSSDTPQTSVPIASEIVLPVVWQQPYPDLDVYRLFVGPFCAGEVARTLTDGWKASSTVAPRIIYHPTKEEAQRDIEMTVRTAP